MNILQNIKDAFNRVFPLHLNSTVEALEDELATVDMELYFSKANAGILRIANTELQETNAEYRRENFYLNNCLENARQHIRVVQQELDDVYSSMTPKLSSWPNTVRSHLEDTKFSHYVMRVELPPLRLSCVVNEAVRRGMYQGYIDTFADSIASTAHKEVKAAVTDILKNALPIK